MRTFGRIINPIMNSFQNGNATQYFALKGADDEERENGYASARPVRGGSTPRIVWFMALSSLFSLLGIVTLLARPSATPVAVANAKQQSMGSTLLSPSKWGSKHEETKAIVIASYKSQDVKWLDKLNTDETLSGWKVYRYIMDDEHPAEGLPVPNSNGRESMAYLTYIVENYDNLADSILFIHGHERAWHQPEPITMKIRNINLTALGEVGVFNLRCPDRPGCGGFEEPLNTVDVQADRQEWRPLNDLWNTIFPNGDHMQDDGALPAWIQNTCCGQFAISKEAIQQRTKYEWTKIREPLVKGSSHYKWAEGYNDYKLGLLYEKLWHLFLGKGAVFCHSADYCKDVQFGGKIKCDRWPEGSFPQLDKDFDQVRCWDDVEDSSKMDYHRPGF